MLILGSYGFSSTSNRLRLSELIADRSGKMLIIPLACAFGAETAEREKNYAAMAGFKKENIFIFDEDKPEELLGMSFSYIAVLGGNTFKLLHSVKEFGLDNFIRDQVAGGAIYMGFSAGAYLACGNIEYVKIFDDNNHITDGDFNALSLTDKYVICHFDCRGEKEIEMCRSFIGSAPELITINNDQLIVL